MPKTNPKGDGNKKKKIQQDTKYSAQQLLILLIFIKYGTPKIIKQQFYLLIDFLVKLVTAKHELITSKQPKNLDFLQSYCEQLLQDLNGCKGVSNNIKNLPIIINKYLQMYNLQELFTFYSKNQQEKLQKKTLTNLTKHDKITFTRPFNIVTKCFAIKQMELDVDKKIKSNILSMPLFKPSRIVNKIQEISHLRKQKARDGHVLSIDHGGHKIIGNRCLAILKRNTFEIWQQSSRQYPQFMFINWHEDHHKNYKEPSIFQINGQFYSRTYFQKVNKDQVSSFKLSHKFIGHRSKITCASFSTDQFYLITGSVDRVIKLWCLRLKNLLAQFKVHTKTVWDLHFNPSGYYFLSGSSDGLMVLWKTDSSTPQRIFSHNSDVYKVRFCHDPNYAVSAGQDGNVKFWQISDGKLIKKIKLQNSIVNFNLGYSGNYIMIIESDGKASIYNLTKGVLVKQFYFYNNLKHNSKNTKKIKIHDGCFSEDEKQIICITQRHILFYLMANLTYNRKCNLYDDFYLQSLTQNKIIPEEIISIQANKRLTSCLFVEFGLLLIGMTKRQ